MQTFLEKLAKYIKDNYINDLNNIHIVFPSQRAGIYLRKYLSHNISKPIFAPKIYSILEFVNLYSDISIEDDINLIFELFNIYKKYLPDTKLDLFYRWGKIILNDFNEIDKNTNKASTIFRIIGELKQTELDFNLDLTDYEQFIEFWKSFSDRELNKTQEEFFKIWKVLGRVYIEFRNKLIQKNIGYEGLALSNLYNKILNNKFELSFKKIIFAGFNKLTQIEKDIIKLLLLKEQAEIFFDGDSYYVNNNVNEAGKFIRENIKDLSIKDPKWIEDKLLTDTKCIKVINSVSVISMLKALGNELEGLNNDQISDTVIVIPELSTLLPLINSIPENIKRVNITVGNIFKNSRLFSMIESIKILMKNYNKTTSKFYYRDVISVLKHPFITENYNDKVNEYIENINKKNIVQISKKSIIDHFGNSNSLFDALFNVELDINSYKINFLKIFDYLDSHSLESYNNVERKFSEYFIDILNKLIILVNQYSLNLEIETFWDILLELVSFTRVPLSGEPFEGLQVMGLLETRQLNFKNVYILSVNEGVLPPKEIPATFIPISLRKAFKLSTIEDSDAIYSNIFYNLIKNAENCVLFYYDEYEGISSKEKSRFILQLEKELNIFNPNITIENYISQSELELSKKKEIKIEKTDTIINEIIKIKNISPSGLMVYLSCKLQFFFKYIANLNEAPSAEEYFTGGKFGLILHEIMNLLYSDYKNKYVNKSDIIDIIKKVEKNYNKIWETFCLNSYEFKEFAQITEGKNYLLKGIINKLVLKILQNDLLEVPFKILKTEDKLKYEIILKTEIGDINIQLYGRLDRIELKDDIIRIIDYKTGTLKKFKPHNTKNDEEYIEKITINNEYKENFQQYFYAYLYNKNFKSERINTGLYSLKQMSEGIIWFDEETISLDKLNLMEIRLIKILSDIFNPKILFTQTENINNCKFCPYKSMCYID